MTYFAPYVDAAGLHIPTYMDIENQLVADAQAVYGSDIYLAPDSQDFQLIAATAQALYDTMLTAQLAYNARSPVSAIGVDLDAVVAINGLQRHGPTASTALVTLAGTAFTVINNGLVGDINANTWALPPVVTLDGSGAASVTATCQVTGPVTALAGQISNIVTPTLGWTSVTNAGAASPGQNTETDSALRARQGVSVENPAQAITTGILGSVLAISGVVSAQLYENDTSAPVATINGVPNASNYPANSISVVVTGGSATDIAAVIADRKTPGCFTNGTTSVTVVDQYGVAGTIRYTIPTTKTITVNIIIKALTGYTSAIGTIVQNNLLNYINSLSAGQPVIISELWQVALAANISPTNPFFSIPSGDITACILGGMLSTADIVMQFNWQAITVAGQISLTVS